MKLMLGGTPVKKMMIHNDTMDATMVASDMQAGVTAYANGQKITGTGKSFEFARYGKFRTNLPISLSGNINVIEIASTEHPIKHVIELGSMKDIDFGKNQIIANIIVDAIEYPITLAISNKMLTLQCEQSTYVQVFYGKDNYV